MPCPAAPRLRSSRFLPTLLLLAGLAAPSPWPGAPDPVLADSRHAEPVERALDVEGVTRSYLISVPAAWDRTSPVPVLFVFHGAGSDAENMVRATGFDALAARNPMLVVYPRAPARTRRYDVDPPPGRVSADLRFVDRLLERLGARFPIDRRRVFATGFSNGAALCYRLAAERSQVFAAVAPVAGYLPSGLSSPPESPVPLLHVHGSADRRVPFPMPTPPGGAPGTLASWARWNGCTRGPEAGPVALEGALRLQRTTWSGPSPRSDTVLLRLEGQDHVWAGGPGGVVSRAVLEFLFAHPRPEPAPAGGPDAGRAAPPQAR